MAKSGLNPKSAKAVHFLFHSRSKAHSMSPNRMTKEVVILIADDDAGHTRLIEKNLGRAGLNNSTRRFEDGQQVLDFLFSKGADPSYSYLLLLDIRMPKID